MKNIIRLFLFPLCVFKVALKSFVESQLKCFVMSLLFERVPTQRSSFRNEYGCNVTPVPVIQTKLMQTLMNIPESLPTSTFHSPPPQTHTHPNTTTWFSLISIQILLISSDFKAFQKTCDTVQDFFAHLISSLSLFQIL